MWGHADPKMRRGKRERGREREHACACGRETPPVHWLLFSYVLFPILGLPCVNWASQECCLSYLRSSLQSLDLPLFYFCRLSPSLSLATAILDSFFLFYLPNKEDPVFEEDSPMDCLAFQPYTVWPLPFVLYFFFNLAQPNFRSSNIQCSTSESWHCPFLWALSSLILLVLAKLSLLPRSYSDPYSN